jgi:DNA-binding NarL/FixJ family response regulator/DNA invertase Pin-like site-specific DNA recombinase
MPTADGRRVVAILTRVSSKQQVDGGHSLETQYLDSAEKARRVFGEDCELRPYADEGVSGTLATEDLGWLTDHTRPGLSNLLADACNGRPDGVVFPSVDRVARRELVFWNTAEKLWKLQVPFYFADSDLDPQTEKGAMMLGFQQSVAADYSRKHRRRMERAYAQRRLEGYPCGNRSPFGWRWEEAAEMTTRRRGFRPHEERAAWVRFMHDRYMGEGWTTTQIAEELNRRGVLRAGGGRFWDSSQVRKVLLSPTHCGQIPEKDGSFRQATHWEYRFWDPEERERIAQKLSGRKKLGSKVVTAEGWPLLGLIRCGHCGARLRSMRPPGSRLAYFCPRTNHADRGRCRGVSKTAEVVDGIVIREVRRIAESAEMQSLALREAEELPQVQNRHLAGEIGGLEGELARMEAKLNGLVDMRAAGEISRERFRDQQARVDKAREAVARRLAAARQELEEEASRQVEMDRVRALLADFGAVWDGLSSQQRRELLSTLVEELTLSRCEDTTGDVQLRLKVHLLPAGEYRLPNLIRRPAGDGIAALGPRELAYLALREDGLSHAEIAVEWQTSVVNVAGYAKKIRRRTGLRDLARVAELARDRIAQVREGLPLSGRVHAADGRPKWRWSERRRQILMRLDRGVHRDHVARELHISRKTVDSHICHMMEHLGVDTWQDLVERATQMGLIPSPGTPETEPRGD